MEFLKQFFIIITISFIGELLNTVIPLPIPASIYGLIIMFLCLTFKIIPLKKVKKTANFLIQIMPVLFIAPASGLLDSIDTIMDFLPAFLIISIVSTILTMGITGKVADIIIDKEDKKGE